MVVLDGADLSASGWTNQPEATSILVTASLGTPPDTYDTAPELCGSRFIDPDDQCLHGLPLFPRRPEAHASCATKKDATKKLVGPRSSNTVDVQAGLILGVTAAATSVTAVYLAVALSPTVSSVTFAVLLIAIAIQLSVKAVHARHTPER